MEWRGLIILIAILGYQTLADEEPTTEAETSQAPTEESTTENPSTSDPTHLSSDPTPHSDNCTTWPANLKPPRDCCQIPHNPASITLNTCFYRCSARDVPENVQTVCGAQCFVNVTGIFMDGKLNKERVKNLYVTGSMMQGDKWIHVMEAAVDKCEYDEKAPLHDGLAKFFACASDYLGDNCVSFIQSSECEKTQELYEECHHVPVNCEIWPLGMASPEYCCKIPSLFSRKLLAKCKDECAYKELFAQRQLNCNEKCLYVDSKLRAGGKFNFDVVKEMLIESADNHDWNKSIESSVEKCKSAIGDSQSSPNLGTNFEITTLQSCLREYLSYDCADYKDDSYCKKVKNFLKKCPDVKPKRTVHFFYHETRIQPGK